MYTVRRWSVRHADKLELVYRGFEWLMVALDPLWRRIGYKRLEKPVAGIERVVKGFLFDCQMCGRCVLSSTGLSCPMNCPKNLHNGPCGGVRADGHCEVKPEMACVWIEAFHGSARIRNGAVALQTVQTPVDWRWRGRSAWLAQAREKAESRDGA